MFGRRLVGSGLWAVLVVGVMAVGSPGPALAEEPDPTKLLYECQAACEKIKDFTATFRKQEQIEGALRDAETVKMKFRDKPFSVYMNWFQDPHKGREVIYVEGKNDGKVVGHQPVGPLNFSKKTEPESAEALKHSLRPITQAGFRNSIRLVIEKSELAKKRNEMLISYLGTEVYNDRPVHVICRIFTAKRDDYPIYVGIFYLDKQTMLPVKIAGYDWDHRLLAVYSYSDVQLNVGLTDLDFALENPAYDFPGVLPFGKVKLPWPFEDKKDEKKKK